MVEMVHVASMVSVDIIDWVVVHVPVETCVLVANRYPVSATQRPLSCGYSPQKNPRPEWTLFCHSAVNAGRSPMAMVNHNRWMSSNGRRGSIQMPRPNSHGSHTNCTAQ